MRATRALSVVAQSVFALWVSIQYASSVEAWVIFTDVTEQAGIRFEHTNGARGEHLFPETVGSGAAFFDYDRDGWLDLYLVNAGDFAGEGAPNVLYHNNGDGTFTDVTERAGVGDTGFGVGVAVGDYDADGWEDLYIANFGRNALYRNNGDGTFTDRTATAGVAGNQWSASPVFFDADGDGDLDLYVANYVIYSSLRDGCTFKGLAVYCGPENFDPALDSLYRNNGDGTFTDVSREAGITQAGRGLGVVTGDYDDDGDFDVFVANDMTPNALYRNRGDGTFEEVGFIAGIALSEDATMGNGMGIALADFDNDGGLDLLVTNFQDQVNTLYRNERNGFFTDVSYPSGTGIPSLSRLAWGCAIIDLDNDGWRDLFIANGHIHDNIDRIEEGVTYAQAQQVFRNEGDGGFEDVSESSGDAVRVPSVSRGLAYGDFDNDGDVDVVLNNLHGRAALLRNDGGNRNAWLRVELEPPSRAVGARVWVETDATPARQMAELQPGGSYASTSDRRVLFGLGSAESARVRVRWPDGLTSGPVETGTRRTIRFVHPGER